MLSTLALMVVLLILILMIFVGEFGIWILLGVGVYAIFKKVMEYLTERSKHKAER